MDAALAPQRSHAFNKDASKQRHLGAAMLLCVQTNAFMLQRRGSAVLESRRCHAFTKDVSRQRHLGTAMLLCVHTDAFILQRCGSAALAPRRYYASRLLRLCFSATAAPSQHRDAFNKDAFMLQRRIATPKFVLLSFSALFRRILARF